MNALEEIQNLKKLKETSNQSHNKIKVQRNIGGKKIIEIESKDILIGDIVFIESNQKLTCDLLLLEGNCLVNEALLTGESVPINKVAYQTN